MSNLITVIIPVHKYDETIEKYLVNAIKSITYQEKIFNLPNLIIVSPPDVNEKLQSLDINKNQSFTLLVNEGDIDYQSQVNLAVDNITTDYFTVLEFDDEFSQTYIYNVEKYIFGYPAVDFFMPIIIEVTENNEAIKTTNESVWSQQIVGENGELGFLNTNALNQHTDFKLSGAIIKKQTFLDIGKYKVNIKLTFMYELLLRALNNACKIFTIPKIGYKHLGIRKDSMFDILQVTMPIDERKFWFETAKNEANFTNDRVIDMSRLQMTVEEEK